MKKNSIFQFILFIPFLFLIGQLSAQEQLEIEGAIVIGDENSSTPPDGTIKYDGSDFLGRASGIWNSLTGSSGGSPWTIIGDDIHYGSIINTVGIGTSAPEAKLHIIHKGSITPHLILEETLDNETTKVHFTNSTNTTDFWSISANLGITSAHGIGWFYNSSPKLVYSESQEGLGINTANPLATLHLYDNSKDTLDLLIAPHSNTGKNSKIIMAEDDDATFNMSWLYEGDLNRMQLHGQDGAVTYGPHMQVKRNNGQVAFGDTFAAGYKVTVDGKVMCEELQVLLKADWPDYVFEEQYKLMPIEELSSFIEKHHHLPGVPTASEVAEEGIAVGEMQKMMMEKIEELTLYIIELQKEVGLLKSENEVLKN